MICLSARNVRKSYGALVALADASIEIECGSILALLGPNGSGKTTLIKILATSLTKDAGEVEILGYDLEKHEMEIRRLLGYVGQDADHSAYARLTVRENLRFFGALRGLSRRQIDARIESLADYFDFSQCLDRLHVALSGGQKQVAIIMRALLTDPPLVFVDEPTKGIDPLTAKKVRKFLRRYVEDRGKSALLTSHALSDVDEMAHKVALISRGSTTRCETVANFKAALGFRAILELPPSTLAAPVEAALAQIGVKRMAKAADDDEWTALGINERAPSLDSILHLLQAHAAAAAYRYRPVTLEDAFIHHFGALVERLDP
jgi:ABC-2 type transport system ATP-binding protein